MGRARVATKRPPSLSQVPGTRDRRRFVAVAASLAVAGVASACIPQPPTPPPPTTVPPPIATPTPGRWRAEVVSVAADDGPADGLSESPSLSANGRFVAFDSTATNLVPAGVPPQPYLRHVYLRDLARDRTRLVDVGVHGEPADAPSVVPSVSADGRRVAFLSSATNLVTGDHPPTDCYVRDLVTGRTTAVSASFDGSPVREGAEACVISADGSTVVFVSMASNLVPDDTSWAMPDLFARDLDTGATTMVGLAGQIANYYYGEAPEVASTDGTRIVFTTQETLSPSDSDGAADVYVHDRRTGAVTLVSDDPGDEVIERVAISGDGTTVAYLDQHWGQGGGGRVRIREVAGGVTTDAFPVDTAFTLSTPELSEDGRYVAFDASPTDELPDNRQLRSGVYVHDRRRATTSAVTPIGDVATAHYDAALSADGRTVAFVTGDPFVGDALGSATRDVAVARLTRPR
jgi:TolB protein